MELNELRLALDDTDRQLVALFERRMAIAREIAAYKQAHGLPVLDASREEAVLASRAAMAQDEALKEPVRELWKELMRLSREEQARWIREAEPC